MSTKKVLCSIVHENIISSVDLFLNPCGDTFALTSSWDKTVRVTDITNNIIVKTLIHDNLVTVAKISHCRK